MFARIATSALLAGFLAGVIAFALQYVFVQPVLLLAGPYEGHALGVSLMAWAALGLLAASLWEREAAAERAPLTF